jgi:uncharacterized membrane protein
MKARLGRVCQKPLHREHLRTATIIVTLEIMTACAISRTVLSTIIAILVFVWDVIFVLLDADDATHG